MNPPRATMRLQLHKGFTFDAAARQVSYLAALGVSHLYVSPIMTARAGSMHGYDVVDPTRVNPELGGEQAFRRLAGALRYAYGSDKTITSLALAVGVASVAGGLLAILPNPVLDSALWAT